MSAPARTRPPRGMTLVIALIMLLVIGLTSMAVMRNVTSADQVALNARLRAQASQYAQLALQFCTHQIELATPALVIHPVQPVAAWTAAENWRGTGPQPAYTLRAATDFNGIGAPKVLPQCLVERSALSGVYSVTARGFSPDYLADAGTGAARSGASVWLQSEVLAPDPAHVVTARTWQQLASPPL